MIAKKPGRPVKASIEDKKLILHRYCIQEGASSLEVLKSHGIFTKLANYAHEIGFPTIKDYDFANDKLFRKYLEEYILSETHRKEVNQESVECSYTPLNLCNFFNKPRQEQSDILTQRDKYYSNLYDNASKALGEFQTIHNTLSALRKEKEEFALELKKQCKENETLKQTINSLTAENNELRAKLSYYRKRLNNGIKELPAPSIKKMEKKITSHTTLQSLISQDVRIRDEINADNNDDNTISDILSDIETIRNKRL